MIMMSKLRIGEPASFKSKLSFTPLELSHKVQEHNIISKTNLPQEPGSSNTTKRKSMESIRKASMNLITTPTLLPKTTIVRQDTLSTTEVVVAMTASLYLHMIKSRPCTRRRTRKWRRSMVEGASTSGKMRRRLHSLPLWKRVRH